MVFKEDKAEKHPVFRPGWPFIQLETADMMFQTEIWHFF